MMYILGLFLKMMIRFTHKYSQKNVNKLTKVNEKQWQQNFDSTIMFRFGETKVAKGRFYGRKAPIKIRHVDGDNIIVPKSIEMQAGSKCWIGY